MRETWSNTSKLKSENSFFMGGGVCWAFRDLKGKFPQITMSIGWVESNCINTAVKFWANSDNLFKRTNYANFGMPPLSVQNSVKICDATREQLSIAFVHRFLKQLGYQLAGWLQFNHKCMHNHLRRNIPKYKSRGNIHCHEKSNCVKFVYSSIRKNFCSDIKFYSRLPPERAAYKKFIKTVKNHD